MNKGLKTIVSLVVIVLIVWAIVANVRTSSSNAIKIGYFGPFTGPVAGSTGLDIANGFKLAYAANHTINGKNVQIVYEDDACDPQKAVSAANKLIDIDKVNVLVSGVCSGSSLSAAPIAEAHKVILFTPVSTTPRLTTAGDYVFRTSASAVVTADAILKYVTDSGYKKVAILYESAEYPTGIKDSFTKKFTAIPGNVITDTESSAPKETDFRTQLTKISQTNADIFLIVMNSTVTANAVLKQRAELAIKTPVIGNEYFIQKEVIANPDAEGVLASTYRYDSTSPAFLSLMKTYQDTYHVAPSQDIYVALAYDGYNVIFGAMEKCGGDNSDCIKDELYKVKDYQGVSGVITIDQNGDTARQFVIKKVSGGKIVDTN